MVAQAFMACSQPLQGLIQQQGVTHTNLTVILDWILDEQGAMRPTSSYTSSHSLSQPTIVMKAPTVTPIYIRGYVL